ncbi:hypothetical protein CsSME_00002446 [Camellia sinensis var. sinensis]
MAPAKKMHRLAPPMRTLIEPYSSPTETPTPSPEGGAANESKTIAPSPSQSNSLSGSETIAPSPFQTNAPTAFETCEASPSEMNPPSHQSQTSSTLHLHQGVYEDQQLENQ